MDCLIKTVKTEGYFGMYRGETEATPTARSHLLTEFDIKLKSTLGHLSDYTSLWLQAQL